MKKILLVGGDLSFVKQDYKILKEKYSITYLKINSIVDIFLRLPKLILEPLKNQMIIIWFGSILSAFLIFFWKLFKKKIIVIAGGYDTANEPSIRYGDMAHPIKKIFQKYCFNNADLVLPVSKHTEKELLTYCKPRKHKIIYNGVNLKKFSPKGTKKKIVITVVHKLTKKVMKKKGIETFVRVSKKLPDIEFIIIGEITPKVKSYLKSLGKDNLKMPGYMNYNRLIKYYRKAKVYAQLSKHESFGVALTEAMLCNCVPVVAKTSALPEIVANTGYYVKYGDIKGITNAIKKALKSKGIRARKHIINNFSQDKRKKALYLVIDEIK